MSDPMNPFASPQADLSPAPGEQWAMNVSPELRQTRIGLTLVYYGIVLALLSVLVMAFGGALVGAAGGPQAVGILFGLMGVALIVASIMMFVGPLFCLGVPNESGARSYIVVSVLFQIANILYTVVNLVMPTALPPALAFLVQLLGIVGTVLFIIFMKKLAEYIGRPDISRQARNVLVGLAVLIGLGLAVMVMTVAMVNVPQGRPGPSFGLFPILALGFGCFALIIFVMYANLINTLRNALRTE